MPHIMHGQAGADSAGHATHYAWRRLDSPPASASWRCLCLSGHEGVLLGHASTDHL
jgi:hypothetical protein